MSEAIEGDVGRTLKWGNKEYWVNEKIFDFKVSYQPPAFNFDHTAYRIRTDYLHFGIVDPKFKLGVTNA